LPEPTPSAAPVETARRQNTRLWAAIHLPALPLEALGEAAASSRPVAVVESEAPRAPIVALTAGARQAGIKTGMIASAACAHVRDLTLRLRDPVREAAALDRLAAWGQRFTSAISLEPPAALLLDIGASLKLFGGVEALRTRMRTELDAQDYAASLALAPTPRAALWLARAGRNALLSRVDQLSGALGALPLATVQLPERTAKDFDRLGVRTLRQAFRLPRDGLARRFSPELLRDWDRALGRAPDPRRHWRAESYFAAERELPRELHVLEQITPFIDGLLDELVAALRRHDAGIDTLALSFKHASRPATRLVLQLLATSRDAAHFKRLWRTRLGGAALPASAIAIRLASGVFQPIASPTVALIAEPAAPSTDLKTLLETLCARLGRNAVFGLVPVADHRPEQAWRRIVPGARTPPVPVPSASRPFWLLARPRPLRERAGLPLHADHPLALEAGPERLEGGWWDDYDTGKDYYIARAHNGTRLWIYREHRGARGWFLHGYFA
jgi:protein ImuB